MSNRTAQADKAIREAWQKEQDLVRDGKGTRDWTPEQQQDILSSGKAYDENGRAFEGQHMKSVEKYPEYQGNPDNIQFLTKKEHLAAHGGSWQNPTNWYYNPVTMEKIDFGDGPCIPCEIIDLNELYIPDMREKAEIVEDGSDIPEKAEIIEETDVAPPDVSDHPAAKVPKTAPAVRPKKRSFGQVLKQAGTDVAEWFAAHPGVVKAGKITGKILVGLGITAGAIGAVYVASQSSSDGSGSGTGDSSGYDNTLSPEDGYSSESSDGYDEAESTNDDGDEEVAEHGTHASPRRHIVPAGGQHYHTKDGVRWIEKEAYPRGGNKSDNEDSDEE